MNNRLEKYPYKTAYELEKNKARKLLYRYYVAKHKGNVSAELRAMANHIQNTYGIRLKIAS